MWYRRVSVFVLIALSLGLLSLGFAGASGSAIHPVASQPPELLDKEGRIPLSLRLKIDPQVLKELYTPDVYQEGVSGVLTGKRVTFIVALRAQADLRGAAQIASKTARRYAVYEALRETAERTQKGILAAVEADRRAGHVSSYKSYYIFNGLAVTGDLQALLNIAARPEVEYIYPNRLRKLPPQPKAEPVALINDALPWGIAKIGADLVWNGLNITGQGVIVANMDTGVDFQHPALLRKYRGYQGGAIAHDYNWLDATGTSPGVPYDDHGHGTHTMGTIVGSEPDGSHRIGVAPGAKWIAVKIFDAEGRTTDDIIFDGFQWILAPTDLLGRNPDPAKAPDVVNNSWGSEEGADTTFLQAVRAWRAAGIMPVFAAGNEGPEPRTVGSPASFAESFAVGATASNDVIAYFSSRGPSPWGEVKPEVSAPGVDIYSSVPGGGYERGWNGTSMATPHVTGLVALLWEADRRGGPQGASKNPTLTITDTERIIMETALDLGVPGPDNDYGWGRIDAYQAVRTVLPHGTFYGRITDRVSGAPVARAQIAMYSRSQGGTVRTISDAQGYYRFDVAVGSYDVTVTHPFYRAQTVRDLEVLEDTIVQLDFALEPLPAGTVVGQVTAAATSAPLVATVEALEIGASARTDAQGRYTLRLPAGVYTIRVFADVLGYRGGEAKGVVVVPQATVTRDFALAAGPRILLVNADAWRQESMAAYYGSALRAQLYSFDSRDILDPPRDNPSASELAAYDVVIWSQPRRSPGFIGAWQALAEYLDGGGRLLISGQDIGYWDVGQGYGESYYRRYLRANYLRDDTGIVQLSGTSEGILHGLSWALNAPDSAQNQLWPSEISPASSLAIPVARYVGDGYAGLQADDCSSRVVYLAFGLEALGQAAREAVLPRIVDWLSAPALDVGVSLVPAQRMGAAAIGARVAYDLSVVNTGRQAGSFALDLRNNRWPTSLLDAATRRPISTVSLEPCSFRSLILEVTVPFTAAVGATDQVIVAAVAVADPSVRAEATLETAAFPPWSEEPPLPQARSRLAVVGVGGKIYAIGGEGVDGSILNRVDIYDPASRTWSTGSPKPTAASNIAAAAIGNRIYVPGGYNQAQLTVLEIYDVSTNRWSRAASLPAARSGAAVATARGKLYVIGGFEGDRAVATTLEYDPATDTWSSRASMAHTRGHAAAAAVNDRIYVFGGWDENGEDLPYVEEYDPATDTWTQKGNLAVAKMGPAAAELEGYIYLVGGGLSFFSPEVLRYDAARDAWQLLTPMPHGRRTLGLAVACGSLYAVAGWNGDYTAYNESFPIGSSLRTSGLFVTPALAKPGDLLTYQVVLSNPGVRDLANSSFYSAIPAGTSYVPDSASGGAVYRAVDNAIVWSGEVPAYSALLFGYQVRVGAELTSGDVITATAVISDGVCGPYAKHAYARIVLPELSRSYKSMSPAIAASGQLVTCTISLRNDGFVVSDLNLVDPIPTYLAYVPGTVTGGAVYDSARNQIKWQGTISGATVSEVRYEWADSDSGGVTYEWIDATGGTALPGGDDRAYGPLPLGFEFTFYEQKYSQFFVNTNGQVLFGEGSTRYQNDPIPNVALPNNFIAAFWDDLNTDSSCIYYQTFGTAPNRYTVIEWNDAGRYGGTASYTFEIILYEGSNAIQLQYRTMTGEGRDGSSATVGIEDATGAEGIQYLYNGDPPGNRIHDLLAIRFWPPAPYRPGEHTIFFQARVSPEAPPNTQVVNTALFTDDIGRSYILTSTLLVNATDLSPSEKRVDLSWAEPGDTLAYSISLRNAGSVSASAALTDTLPLGVSYVPGSVSGGASYDTASRRVTWRGVVPAGREINIGFRVRVDAEVADGQVITNTAEIRDLTASLNYRRSTRTVVQRPDLSASAKFVSHRVAVSGDTLTYTIVLTNTAPVAARNVRVWDPIPANATYVPGSVTGGAQYDATRRAISWSGNIDAARPSGQEGQLSDDKITAAMPARHVISFRVRVDSGLPPNTEITNVATITQNSAISYTRSALTRVNVVDLSRSTKTASPPFAASGDVLNYTVTLLNEGSQAAANARLLDYLPPRTTYVSGSATGGATYNAAENRLEWRGTVPGTQVETQGGWSDSDSGAVTFAWIDARDGNAVPGGDDVSRGPFPIGFSFSFYGQTYTEFYINTNGQVLFGAGSSAFGNVGIPNAGNPNNFIAAFWDDLVCPQTGCLYYKTAGEAPHRYTVIEWYNAGRYGSDDSLTFEIVLYEGSPDVLVQYLSLSGAYSGGSSATVGIENANGSAGVQYLYDGAPSSNLLHSGLAVKLSPPRGRVPGQHTITYALRVAPNVPSNARLVNVARLDDGLGHTHELSATVLVNTTDLSASAKSVDKAMAQAGDLLNYTIVVRNSGTGAAQNVTVHDPLPAGTTYVPGSATGGASYDPVANRIAWSGSLAPGQSASLSFAVRTDPFADDLTVITNTAWISDGFSSPIARMARTVLRAPNFSASTKSVSVDAVSPGQTVTYTIRLRNSSEITATARLTDYLPAEVRYVPGSLWASSGDASFEAGALTWQGRVLARGIVVLRFRARVDLMIPEGSRVVNAALLNTGARTPLRLEAAFVVQGPTLRVISLPLIFKLP